MQEVTESDEPKEGVGISETQAKGSMQLKLRSLRWVLLLVLGFLSSKLGRTGWDPGS